MMNFEIEEGPLDKPKRGSPAEHQRGFDAAKKVYPRMTLEARAAELRITRGHGAFACGWREYFRAMANDK